MPTRTISQTIDLTNKPINKYITEITGGGIKVHDSDDILNYIQLTSDGMEVFKTDGAESNPSTISVAKFGSTVRIGKTNEAHIEQTSTGLNFVDSSGVIQASMTANNGTFVLEDVVSAHKIELGSGLAIENYQGETLASFSESGSQIGKDDEGHVVTESDGVTLYVGNEDIVHLHHYRGQIAYLSNNNGKSVVIDSWESPTSTGDRSSVSVRGGGSYGSAIELTANSTGTNNQPLMAGILVQADNALDEEKIYLYGKVEATGYVRDTIISATPTITRTSGGSVSNVEYRRSGNVAQLRFTLKYSTSVAAGGNVFEGTIPDGYRPSINAYGCGYYGEHAIICLLSTTGGIVCRNASNSAVTISAASGAGISFTYIID